MALQISQFVDQTTSAFLNNLDKQDADALAEHVDVVIKLATAEAGGKQSAVTPQDVKDALASGWTTDYFSGASLSLNIAGSLTEVTETDIDANGKVSFGPIQAGVDLTRKDTSQQQASFSGTINYVRQSRSAALQNAMQALSLVQAAPVPPVPASKTS